MVSDDSTINNGDVIVADVVVSTSKVCPVHELLPVQTLSKGSRFVPPPEPRLPSILHCASVISKIKVTAPLPESTKSTAPGVTIVSGVAIAVFFIVIVFPNVLYKVNLWPGLCAPKIVTRLPVVGTLSVTILSVDTLDKAALAESSKRLIVSVPTSSTAVCKSKPMFPVNKAPSRDAFL